jgi:hypothetical protein
VAADARNGKESAVMMNMHEACAAIVANRHEKALNYAVHYAYAGMHMTGDDARVQAIYILNNMSRWRGPTAKLVRESLRAIAK